VPLDVEVAASPGPGGSGNRAVWAIGAVGGLIGQPR
jgi:hypothetical protein